MKPLVKWPGGKRFLTEQLLQLLPSKYGTYYEPFFGGGALFFAASPKKAVLSDVNEDLINLYIQVRDNPEELISALSRMPNTEDDYYEIRSRRTRTELTRAAKMLYLSSLSFNGIYRVNLAGDFNVPYGRKDWVKPCDRDQIRLASEQLKNVDLLQGDFQKIIERAKPGDVVYLDPPYTVAHGNNGFLKYNENIFSWDDQVRLSNIARKLRDRNVFVIISNADHVSVRELYSDFVLHTVERVSKIAASSHARRPITEIIATGSNLND